MEDNLKKLYATMLLIETKGESTKIMGECLKFIEQMINDAKKREVTVTDSESK